MPLHGLPTPHGFGSGQTEVEALRAEAKSKASDERLEAVASDGDSVLKRAKRPGGGNSVEQFKSSSFDLIELRNGKEAKVCSWTANTECPIAER